MLRSGDERGCEEGERRRAEVGAGMMGERKKEAFRADGRLKRLRQSMIGRGDDKQLPV